MPFNKEYADYCIRHTYFTIEYIARTLGCTYSVLGSYYRANFSEEFKKKRKSECYRRSKLGKKNPMFGKFREKHHNFKGDCSDCKGYVLVLKPSWFTGRPNSKHIFKHHYEYCKAHNLTEIPNGCAVHHKDFNPLNNEPDNLKLLTNSDHSKLHHKEKRDAK